MSNTKVTAVEGIEDVPVNGYHHAYKKEYLAELPELIPEDADDREEYAETVICLSENAPMLSDEEYLRNRITHLPFDTILKIFEFANKNVEETIKMAEKMVTPKLMPETAKTLFKANIAIERDEAKEERKEEKKKEVKRIPASKFHMVDLFKGVVNDKTLVDCYYHQKNDIGTNYRLELDDMKAMKSQEMKKMEELMKKNGLKHAIRDPDVKKSHRAVNDVLNEYPARIAQRVESPEEPNENQNDQRSSGRIRKAKVLFDL